MQQITRNIFRENPLTEKSVKITYSRDDRNMILHGYTKRIPYGRIRILPTICILKKQKGLNVVKYGAVEVKYMVRTTILSEKSWSAESLE